MGSLAKRLRGSVAAPPPREPITITHEELVQRLESLTDAERRAVLEGVARGAVRVTAPSSLQERFPVAGPVPPHRLAPRVTLKRIVVPMPLTRALVHMGLGRAKADG